MASRRGGLKAAAPAPPVIERAFEAALRARLPEPELPAPTADAVARALFALTAADTGPSLSRHLAKKATLDQAHEFLVHRRRDEPCPACGTTIVKFVAAGRGTYACETCQPRPRVRRAR